MVPRPQHPSAFGTRPSWRAPRRWRINPDARRRLASRAIVVALAAGALVVSDQRLDRARELEQRWGPTVEVLIARRDLPAGLKVGQADVITEVWPDLIVGGVDRLPTDAVPARPIARGEPLTAAMFDDDTSIGAGQLVVSVRPRQPTPDVGPGDRVALLGPDGRLDATVVAVDRGEGSLGSGDGEVDITVSVDADAAARLAAWAEGDVVVALRGADDRDEVSDSADGHTVDGDR